MRTTRRKADVWDRIKFLVILIVITTAVVGSEVAPPFVTLDAALRDFFSTSGGQVVLFLFFAEIIRQIHYFVSERSAGYHSFWQRGFFGRIEGGLDHLKPWTRFRVGRFVRWTIIISIYALIVTYLVPEISSPIEAITQAPRLLVAVITSPFFIQAIVIFTIAVGQFVMIFWFLSRGGMNVVMPEEIKTRFSDVWGQDHVLDLIKENIAFLEKPDEIEAKGGYIPGGILLWGPPGTGKTLMAEAIAGETGRPYVFVEPGAFINMFFGVGILKVKSLYRKLRKLSLRHGGVIVFLDEADSLGSRGALGAPTGGLGGSGQVAAHLQCNGFHFLSPFTQNALASVWELPSEEPEPPRRSWINRIIMGAGMGGGGMGTLQALLTEMNGLTKPRGLGNRIRKLLGFRPKPPPKYRILHILATNMPNALDEAMLRPGRIDRIYKVGYPSKEGRKATLEGYLNKVSHALTEEEIEKLAVVTPMYSGARIKDLVNEALIIAIRDGREKILWPDIWKAKALKELGPPEDVDYIERERHAVAVHEASHAVAAHLLGVHRRIDMVTIEKRATTLGMVRSLGQEERFTQWMSEFETDIMVSLASRAGERMFFGDDNSSGVSGDLTSATTLGALMEGAWGMGQGLVSYAGTSTNAAGGLDSPISVTLRARRDQIEEKLEELYERVQQLLDDNRDKVLELAAVLEEKKTISGDEVAEIMGSLPGEKVMREPVGWQTVTGEVSAQRRQEALARRQGLGNGRDGAEVGGDSREEGELSANGHQADEEPAEA
ncbi:MAG TPA: AAA family ATPase [Acidimicrobiia bacterium]|nr:AAA family ATPase [Acidimicrobiia bacterium]